MRLPKPIAISDITGKDWEFDTLAQFRKFLKTEYEFWLDKENTQKAILSTTHSYLEVTTRFQAILDAIKLWGNITNLDEATLTNHLANLQSSHLNSLQTIWVWHGHYFVTPWLESYKLSHTTGEAFIQSVLNKQIHRGTIPNIASYEWFRGYLLACETELQSNFHPQLNVSKEESLNKAKEILSDAKDELSEEIDAFQESVEVWRKIEDGEITRIKKTFTDDMRLRGATKYWNSRAKHYKERGRLWIGILGATLIVSTAVFSSLLYAWIRNYSTPLKLNTIEGAILAATVISLVAFAVRLFSKLALSAFHLQSDAEERSEITYVYLALSKDNQIDMETRNIVFQSIFSRVDTGLLGKESSPTLPIQDVIRSIKPQNNG